MHAVRSPRRDLRSHLACHHGHLGISIRTLATQTSDAHHEVVAAPTGLSHTRSLWEQLVAELLAA